MKRKIRLNGGIIIVMLLALLSTSPAWSVPNLISYQGVLMDSDGVPVDGPVNMSFSVYDVETEGTALWSEDHAEVALDNGVYNVLLGDGTTISGSFDINLFSQDNLWLEVIVNGEVLTPRISFTSSAFGFKAKSSDIAAEADHAQNADTAQHATTADNAANADTVDGQHASSFAASTHDHKIDRCGGYELVVVPPRGENVTDIYCPDACGPDSKPIACGYRKHWDKTDQANLHLLDVDGHLMGHINGLSGFNREFVPYNWCRYTVRNNASESTGKVSLRIMCVSVKD